MRREEYLHTLTEQIRCKMARGTIEQEINDHIEDQKEEFLSEGMSQTEGEDAGSETTEAGSSSTESTFTSESILSAEQSTNENGTVNTSASVQEAPKLSFSEDTLMEWPVDGNILMDYNMDQTVYFPTLCISISSVTTTSTCSS
mgnify:FL=1